MTVDSGPTSDAAFEQRARVVAGGAAAEVVALVSAPVSVVAANDGDGVGPTELRRERRGLVRTRPLGDGRAVAALVSPRMLLELCVVTDRATHAFTAAVESATRCQRPVAASVKAASISARGMGSLMTASTPSDAAC